MSQVLQQPGVMLRSMKQSTTKGHVDIHSLLLLEVMLVSRAATKGHVDVGGLQPPEAMLMSIVHPASKDHIWVCGPPTVLMSVAYAATKG